ncbi:ATP-binding protein [Streptomyces sp. NPDC001093]|uniref:ATP-binding protein n=1 Tax=Streptomyces sp. NPDC001093 TaxID=3154376 RepID=UPI00332A25FB
MAPPSVPQPLHHPPEHRSPARPPLPPGSLRLPAVPRRPRAGDRPDPTSASIQHPYRSPTDADRPHPAPHNASRSDRVPDNPSRSERAPDSADHPDPTPDRAHRPHPPLHGANQPNRSLDGAERRHGWAYAADGPDPCADATDAPDRASDRERPRPASGDTDDRPRPAREDTGDHPHPAPDAPDHAHRPPVPAGGPRPPGGGRPGRLPGPLGPDRLASGDPLARSAAAFDLAAQPTAVGTARRVVDDLLTAWGVPDGPRDDAVLVTSELVTNALVHAAGERIACRLHGTADLIRIEVEDQDGGPTLPAARRPGPDDQHGRGLFLVDALSRDWGVTPESGGPARVVWAELPYDDG